MMDCFFGNNAESEKIEGKEIPAYVSKLIEDLASQVVDLGHVLFGVKFLELGLTSKDR